jgi:hypothetical protein
MTSTNGPSTGVARGPSAVAAADSLDSGVNEGDSGGPREASAAVASSVLGGEVALVEAPIEAPAESLDDDVTTVPSLQPATNIATATATAGSPRIAPSSRRNDQRFADRPVGSSNRAGADDVVVTSIGLPNPTVRIGMPRRCVVVGVARSWRQSAQASEQVVHSMSGPVRTTPTSPSPATSEPAG